MRKPTALGLAVRLALILTAALLALPALALGLIAAAVLAAGALVFIVLLLLSMLITPVLLMFSRTPKSEPADDGRRNVRVVANENPADET